MPPWFRAARYVSQPLCDLLIQLYLLGLCPLQQEENITKILEKLSALPMTIEILKVRSWPALGNKMSTMLRALVS